MATAVTSERARGPTTDPADIAVDGAAEKAVATDALWLALERVDILLARAVEQRLGTVERGPIERLAQPAGGTPLDGHRHVADGADGLIGPLAGGLPMLDLARAYRLDEFELGVLLLALAPDLDPRYPEIFGWLENREPGRPSLDLVLDLLCASREDRRHRMAHFLPDAPLLRSGALRLTASSPGDPLPWHRLQADAQAVRLTLGAPGLDGRLVDWCDLDPDPDVHPDPDVAELPHARELSERLAGLVDRALEENRACRVHLFGRAHGMGDTAEWMAERAGLSLLKGDLRRLHPEADVVASIELGLREARIWGWGLFLEGLERLDAAGDGARCWAALYAALRDQPGLVVLAGSGPPVAPEGAGPAVLPLAVPPADAEVRRHLWRSSLGASPPAVDDEDLATLAARFRLSPARIADAAETARLTAANQPDLATLFDAARSRSRSELASLSRRISPAAGWSDLVLPDDAMLQLRELCNRITMRDRVLDEWGFGRSTARGHGTSALFAGPSGTGKTMAAEVIAAELGFELYQIDLAGVVSKYIGETEKNLRRVFEAAHEANAVLFFDEADALFGKRSEVRDSHDRYANVEVSYLLQQLEDYDGVAVLASNLPHHLDEAFVRRLSTTVVFPFPEADVRRRIWSQVWPATVPLAGDVDLDRLAEAFRFSGGNIRNVALQAAYGAASADRAVTMTDVLHAVRREYQKLGKALQPHELSGVAEEGRR